jgi:NADH-quinone oxidoreductase subunit F
MDAYEPVLLRRILKNADVSIDAYRADGGYKAMEKAFSTMTPEQVIETVKESGLRGRGGAGFPTGLKWTFLPKNHHGPVYFCVNADESEPCTFNNRVLMEGDPHQLLEGVILAGYATRTSVAYIYLRYEYGRCYRVLGQAIAEAYKQGLLGKNILGREYSLDVYVHRGAGAYICGEETGLIESLEGKRAWPRVKPPFPAVEGLFRKPTVVNNIETLVCVTHILDKGYEWFKSIGVPPDPSNPRDAGSYGPKLYNISGHVNKPGTVELPLGVTVRDLIDKHGGGVWKNRKA